MSLRSECRKSEYSSRFPRCLSILTTDAADAAWAAAWAATAAACAARAAQTEMFKLMCDGKAPWQVSGLD